MTRRQRWLARFVERSVYRGDEGASLLFLRDSGGSAGCWAVTCRGTTISALCEAGVLDEDPLRDTGVWRRGRGPDCCCSRTAAAGPAEDLAEGAA